MSQQQVYNLLKSKKEPVTIKEISNELNLGQSGVSHSLSILKKWNEIEIIKERDYRGTPLYRYKIKDGEVT